MDLLVALSTTVIYIHSAYTALTVHQNVKLYFLSEGVLLSLILFGKYIESTSRYEASETIRKLIRLQPETANVLRGDTVQTVGIEELKPEDAIIIRGGERVPIDGAVIDGTSKRMNPCSPARARLCLRPPAAECTARLYAARERAAPARTFPENPCSNR